MSLQNQLAASGDRGCRILIVVVSQPRLGAQGGLYIRPWAAPTSTEI